MKLIQFNYHNWLKAKSHQDKSFFDKWSREIYPWRLFNRIDFDINLTNQCQKINIEGDSYFVTLKSLSSSFDNRYVSDFLVKTIYENEYQKWEKREWDTVFEIVFSSKGEFITVFIKDFNQQDEYKRYLRNFKDENFDIIVENRSLPLLFLLNKTLTALIIEENIPNVRYLEEFLFDKTLFKGGTFNWKYGKIVPLWSLNREHWFFSSASEEKAHKLGIMLAGQCKKLTIIYCQPTHTDYFKCKHSSVTIISLMEYGNRVKTNSRYIYENHILLLQSFLHKVDDRPINHILQRIDEIKKEETYVRLEDLREAMVIYRLPIYNIFDAFYCISCTLILNSWQDYTKAENKKGKKIKYNKDIYSFKEFIPSKINNILNSNIEDIKICYKEDEERKGNIVFIKIFGFQFSFHVIAKEKLLSFIYSDKNVFQEWSGKRLKPITILLLILSRKVYYWSKNIINKIILTADLYCETNNEWLELNDLVIKINRYFPIKEPLTADYLKKNIVKENKVFEIENNQTDNNIKFRIKKKKFSDENKDIYNFIIRNIKNY